MPARYKVINKNWFMLKLWYPNEEVEFDDGIVPPHHFEFISGTPAAKVEVKPVAPKPIAVAEPEPKKNGGLRGMLRDKGIKAPFGATTEVLRGLLDQSKKEGEGESPPSPK
jgi:hypothetical protein